MTTFVSKRACIAGLCVVLLAGCKSDTTPTLPPAPPTGVTAAAGDGRVTLTWTSDVAGATFNVYWSTSPGVTKPSGTRVPSVTSPYVHQPVANGTTCWYVVTALKDGQESAESAKVSATPQAAVAGLPGNVMAAGADRAVTITWGHVANALSYNLYWSNAPGVTKTNGNRLTGVASPYSHAPLTNGVTYYYVVTAISAAGEGPESAQVSATPSATLPPAPPGSVAAAAGNATVTVAWQAVTGATSYNLYWSNANGVTKANGTKVAGVTSPYLHLQLTNGLSYYYVVTAVGPGGESAESSQVSATPTATAQPPPAPTGVTATPGDRQVTVAWQAVTGATSYNLYWSNANGVTKANGTKVAGVTSPYTHTSLTNGQSYYYLVTAVGPGGESAESSQASATPATLPTPAPTGFTATVGDGTVTLSWQSVPVAATYSVYWSNRAGVTKASGTQIPNVTSPYGHQQLMNGKTYYYVVTAVGPASESAESEEKSATPWTPVPPAHALSVLAGIPSGRGTVDGAGPEARFNRPSAVAVDGSGNLYVADTESCTVRKITPAGIVTTLAGAPGQPGYADGAGTAARFDAPTGVAVDGAGNVYVSDSTNQIIRKIGPDGAVTTLAGLAHQSGSADGVGAGARFLWPGGVAVDGSGNVYVADTGNFTIRKITPAGVVTTMAGMAGQSGSADGTGSVARFSSLASLTVDGSGTLYVGDQDTVRKVAPAGLVTTLAGVAGQSGSADGTGSAARFGGSLGVAADQSGNVYVADGNGSTIRKVTPAGVVTTLAGAADQNGSADGSGLTARFNQPTGIAVDQAANLVYVTDTANNDVRRVTTGGVVTTVAGTPGQAGSADGTGTAARFSGPSAVATDGSGNAYVADTWNDSIRVVTPAGVVTTLPVWGSQFNGPRGVAVDASGQIYVADHWTHTIRKISSGGAVTVLAGLVGESGSADGTGGAARFNSPSGLAVDGSGNAYVADTYNSTIRKVTPAGTVTTLAGAAGQSGSADGAGAAATFYSPGGVAADAAGNVFVADTYNSTIRKITPAGVVSTLAGAAGETGTADGNGAVARFFRPEGITLDGAGNIYVADTGNSTIRKITPVGVVTTVVGVPLQAVTATGPLPASLAWPTGVAVDPTTGNLFVVVLDSVLEVRW
jgi:DNA-binding beta-propeller fold protein YncE/fibronectin type 3 domain-containing protein